MGITTKKLKNGNLFKHQRKFCGSKTTSNIARHFKEWCSATVLLFSDFPVPKAKKNHCVVPPSSLTPSLSVTNSSTTKFKDLWCYSRVWPLYEHRRE